MAERTAKDYAIEHAEYMAKAAEAVLDAGFDGGTDEALDARQALRNRIYEFRKRAERASSGGESA